MLAVRWGGPGVAPLVPREPLLLAIGLHDAGWPDLDATPHWDPATGQPHTYRTHALSDALEVAERSVARVAAADPYAGWLVSRHFASFHEGDSDPAAAAWLEVQGERREELIGHARQNPDDPAAAPPDPAAREMHLDWLQLLDALSLALCHDWQTWESRPIAPRPGSRGIRWRYDRDGASGTLAVTGRVTPGPFDVSSVAARLPARLLDGTRWRDADALARAWDAGRPVTVEVALGGG